MVFDLLQNSQVLNGLLCPEIIMLADPERKAKMLFGGAAKVFTLYRLFDCERQSIVDDHSAKKWQVRDRHTAFITHDYVVFEEVEGGRGAFYSVVMSIRTGGSLRGSMCPITGVKFEQEKFYCYGEGDALGPKVISYLADCPSFKTLYPQCMPDPILYQQALGQCCV